MNRIRMFGALAVALFAASAQDTRNVTEPVIPQSCTILAAKLPARLAEADENKPDTLRIQDALDRCAASQAVELKAAGDAHAFLAGPLQLRAGVALLVDGGAILFASRNPRDYDASPGSCGVVNKAGRGCKALITGDHVAHAGVMGDGWIDGRGPSTLTG